MRPVAKSKNFLLNVQMPKLILRPTNPLFEKFERIILFLQLWWVFTLPFEIKKVYINNMGKIKKFFSELGFQQKIFDARKGTHK